MLGKRKRATPAANSQSLVHRPQFPLSPADFSTYVKLAQIDTGGLLYIRSGSRQLAGSTPRGPSRLPRSGSVKFRGASYEVSSFQAPSSVGTVQIYELVTT